MKATLLLSDEPGRALLTLNEVTLRESSVREFVAHAGCNCDRWGHPCPGCVEPDLQPEAKTPIFTTSKNNNEISKCNT